MHIYIRKPIFILFLFGLLLRIIFLLFFAESFYLSKEFYLYNDSGPFISSITNFIDFGQYTIALNIPYADTVRSPGYPIFIGIFYLLSFKNLEVMYGLIIGAQILIDTLSIYLIYIISLQIFKIKKVALVNAFLYASYPFVIVWSPVIMSETLSIFILLLSLYVFLKNQSTKNLFLCGFLIAWGMHTRPNLVFIPPIFTLLLLYYFDTNIKLAFKKIVILAFPVLIVYGAWPIRNYIKYNEVILVNDVRGYQVYQEDVTAFRSFIYSMQAEWEPQFTQIITNQEVDWPYELMCKGDSVLLKKAEYLSKTCGLGFSRWGKYWKEPLDSEGCTEEIANIYNQLRVNQIKTNPINYHVIVPFQNLKKCFFKSKLNQNNLQIQVFVQILFFYRSLLLIFGMIGIIQFTVLFKNYTLLILSGTFLFLLYFTIAYFARNVEMRYLLPADILMLIPVGYFIHRNLILFRFKNE